MLKPAFRPLTVHDYRELPEGPPYYQLLEGEMEISPSPNRYHQEILRNITSILLEHLRKHPVGEIYFAPFDVFLTDLNVFQPDLVFISNSRKSILSDQGVEGAPDLVVEVLSPKTAKLDRGVKREIYARTGVEELWIVDPELKQVQLYHFAESADVPSGTYGIRQSFSSTVLRSLKVAVAKVFKR